jgi:hypothetical protein
VGLLRRLKAQISPLTSPSKSSNLTSPHLVVVAIFSIRSSDSVTLKAHLTSSSSMPSSARNSPAANFQWSMSPLPPWYVGVTCQPGNFRDKKFQWCVGVTCAQVVCRSSRMITCRPGSVALTATTTSTNSGTRHEQFERLKRVEMMN